jgi:hypothetical protein
MTVPQPEPHPQPFPEPGDPGRRPDPRPRPEPQPRTPDPEPRPKPTAWRVFLLALLAAGSLTCSDSPTQPIVEPCPGDTVEMRVSAGLTPLFTWAPNCGVGFLEVYPASGGGALWTIYAETAASSDNPIPSGVRYGRTPSDAETAAGPQPLESGSTYRVRVSRLICHQGELCTLQDAGAADFQP